MQIFLRSRAFGAVQALEVLETDVVERLRQKILETELYYPAWHDWRLMVGELELRCDDKPLAYYRVQDGTVLEIHERSHVKIGVRCPPSGRMHMVVCEITDRICDCKKRLSEAVQHLPTSTRQAWLLPDGEELPDFITLQDSGITTDAVIDMAGREPLPIRVAIKTEDGRAFWLNLDEWDSIADVRIQLGSRNCNVMKCSCRGKGHADDALASIMYEAEELDDDEQFFGAYGIPNSSTLFLNERLLGERIRARAPVAEKVPPPSALLGKFALPTNM